MSGWLVHYNYLRPHTALNDKTPAEVAGIIFPYKNWADITRHKPSKPIVVSHVERGTMRLQDTHIGRPRSRVRAPKTTTPKPSKQVLVQQTRGGSTLFSRKRVRGTRVVGRYGRGR